MPDVCSMKSAIMPHKGDTNTTQWVVDRLAASKTGKQGWLTQDRGGAKNQVGELPAKTLRPETAKKKLLQNDDRGTDGGRWKTRPV
jgi:hypothetical protein